MSWAYQYKRRQLGVDNSDDLCDQIMHRQLFGNCDNVEMIPFRVCVMHIFTYLECFCLSAGVVNRRRSRTVDDGDVIVVPRDWRARFRLPVSIRDLYGYFILDRMRCPFLLYRHFRIVANIGDDLLALSRILFGMVRASSLLSISANFCVPDYLPSQYIAKCTAVNMLHMPTMRTDWLSQACLPALRSLVLATPDSLRIENVNWVAPMLSYVKSLRNLVEFSIRGAYAGDPVSPYGDVQRILMRFRAGISRARRYGTNTASDVGLEEEQFALDTQWRLYPWVGLASPAAFSLPHMRFDEVYETIIDTLHVKHVAAHYRYFTDVRSLQPIRLQHMGVRRIDVYTHGGFEEYADVPPHVPRPSVDVLIECVMTLVRRQMSVSLYYCTGWTKDGQAFGDICKRFCEAGFEIIGPPAPECLTVSGSRILMIRVAV